MSASKSAMRWAWVLVLVALAWPALAVVDSSDGFAGSGSEEGAASVNTPGLEKITTGTVKVNTWLNIRTGPWGQIIGKFHNGDEVKIIGREGDWYKISWNGKLAYCHTAYVEVGGKIAGTPPDGNGTGSNPGSGSTGNVPNVGTPAAGAKGGKALLGWLQKAGLTGDKLRCAWAIAMKESGGNPRAFNGNANTGDKSYGLYQINMIGSMGPARLKQYGLKSNEELFDPMVNIRCMLKLSNNATNWGPWAIGPNAYRKSASVNAAFQKYYNAFPPK